MRATIENISPDEPLWTALAIKATNRRRRYFGCVFPDAPRVFHGRRYALYRTEGVSGAADIQPVSRCKASSGRPYGRSCSRNYRLPCPADGTAPVDGAGVSGSAEGVENCGIPTSGTAYVGVIPWKTMGLQPTDALDGWGHRIGYAVTPGTQHADGEAIPVHGPQQR